MKVLRMITTLVTLMTVQAAEDCSNVTLNVTSTPIQPLVEGQRVTLFCTIGQGGDVNFRLVNTTKPLVTCSGTSCSELSSTGVYQVSRNDSGVALTITKLDRKRDGNIWVCSIGSFQGCYDLRNITVPIKMVSISIGKVPAYSNPSHKLVVPTGTQEFRCQTDRNGSSPHATFQWYLIEANVTVHQLRQNVTISVNKSSVNSDLVISESTVLIQINRNMEGWILQCSAGNNRYTASAGAQVRLKVVVPIRNVTISQGSAVTRGEVTGDSGSLQGFSCRTNPGSPHATFHWRLIQTTGATTELVPNSTVYTNATGDRELVTSVGTLQFMFDRSMNAASLECSATNNNITRPATDSVQLNVLYGPDVVRLQTISPGYSDGSHVTALKCTANCNPPCTYQWSRAGQMVHKGSVLSIPKLTNMTAGQYTCLTSYGGRNFTTKTFLVMVMHDRPRADQKSSPSSAPIVAGISMGFCLVVIATITVAVYIRRKRKFSKRQGVSTTEMTSSEEDGHNYENATIKTRKEPQRLKPKPNDENAPASASGPEVYTDLQPRGPDDFYEDISFSNDP